MPDVTPARQATAALHYSALGWRVLPLHSPTLTGACSCGRTNCPNPAKHPHTRHGARDATTDAPTITAWWTAWPNANIGLATGELIVIDVDGAAGNASLRRLEHAHTPLPTTLEAATSRGRHLYFSAPASRLGNSAGRLGDGLDVRGHGGYVIAPPSLHADGRRYRWHNRHQPAGLPEWVAELLSTKRAVAAPALPPLPPARRDRRRRYLAAAVRAELAAVADAQSGTRNDTLNRSAFRLAQLAADDASTLDELEHQLLSAALTTGLSEPEARATIASGLSAGQQHPRR